MNTHNTEYYDIHGLVTARIRWDHYAGWFPGINQPLQHFRVPILDDTPDISVQIGAFEPDLADCCTVDHKYHIRQNYLYCADQHRSFRWRVEIKGLEHGPTEIRLHIRRAPLRYAWLAPGMLPYGIILRHILAYKLHQRGALLLHAAACEKEGRALVLFGGAGVYKTTHLMQFMRMQLGWHYLGDDTLIFYDGKIYSFPTYPAFFGYRLKYKQTEDLSFLDKLILPFYSLRTGSKDLQIAQMGVPDMLVHCKMGVGKPAHFIPADPADSLRRLVHTSMTEDHSNGSVGVNIFSRYIEAYNFVFPQNHLGRRWEIDHQTLMQDVRHYEIQSSEKYDLAGMCKLLQNMIGEPCLACES